MSAHLSRLRLFQRHLRSLVWVWVWFWDWVHWHTSPRTRSPSCHPPFTHYPFPPRSLVCGGQTPEGSWSQDLGHTKILQESLWTTHSGSAIPLTDDTDEHRFRAAGGVCACLRCATPSPCARTALRSLQHTFALGDPGRRATPAADGGSNSSLLLIFEHSVDVGWSGRRRWRWRGKKPRQWCFPVSGRAIWRLYGQHLLPRDRQGRQPVH
jgi:hypothetical protein